jgi:hypothetical protein
MADHTQLDWRPQLPRLQLPCLNVIGCQSGVFPIEGCEAVNKGIPGTSPRCKRRSVLVRCGQVPATHEALMLVSDRFKTSVMQWLQA